MKNLFDNDIKVHRDRLEVARQLEEDKQEFKLLIEELEQIKNELNVNYEKIIKYIEIRPDETSRRIVERQQRTQQLFRGFNNDEEQGLTAQRILQFQQYVRRNRGLNNMLQENMMRLDCDGEHTFCQVCIERWFATNKTCPICGHMFQ